MSLTAERGEEAIIATDTGPAARSRPFLRQLWVHVLALAVVLFGLVIALDNGSMVSADEGAVLTQVRILDETGVWATPHRSLELDPSGEMFPIDLSDQEAAGFVPYGKHPAYPTVALWLYRLGGLRFILFGSAVGTLGAAALAALIARRLSPKLDVATLWIAGLASPLVFDGSWVIAHSIAAAFVTLAMLSALRTLDNARRLVWPMVIVVSLGCAVLFRTEALLFGAAMSVTLAVAAIAARMSPTPNRPAMMRCVVAAGASASGTILGWWIDLMWFRSVNGDLAVPGRGSLSSSNWAADRLDGIWNSLLRPQMIGTSPGGNAAMMIAIAALAGTIAARRGGTDAIVRACAGAVLLGSVLTLLAGGYPVPGLFVAFPLLGIGLAALQKKDIARIEPKLILGVSLVFSCAVVATQYAVGGATDWGGRYFHLMLPALIPVLLISTYSMGQRMDEALKRLATTALIVALVAMGVFAVRSSAALRDDSLIVVEAVAQLGSTTSSAEDPMGPVIVSNMPALGRRSWTHVLDARYLRALEPQQIRRLDSRLVAADIDEFVFVDGHVRRSDRALLTNYRADPARTVTVAGWKLYVMKRATG